MHKEYDLIIILLVSHHIVEQNWRLVILEYVTTLLEYFDLEKCQDCVLMKTKGKVTPTI